MSDTNKTSYYWRNREAVLARRKQHRAARSEHYKEKGREQMRRWRAANPRASPNHGLTPAEISARLAKQGGACAVCGSSDPGKGRWHGDHDHSTGRFRAVLCGKCNMGLGLFSDSVRKLKAAAAYLELHALL